MILLPCKGTEYEGNNHTPSSDGGSHKHREIEEIHETHSRYSRPHEKDREEPEGEIVKALEADDLRQNEPRIPYDRPIEHDSSPPCSRT